MSDFKFRRPGILTYPLSRVFGAITTARNILYDRRLLPVRHVSMPVICVGNITAGGTGKTPMVMYILTILKESGLAPMVVSRGYGGSAGKRPERVPADGCFDRFGDEPVLMTRRFPDVPVIVSQDRYRGVIWGLDRYTADCVVMDDGFQHRRLARDLNIVMVDCRRPVFSDRMLPMGRLREHPRGLRRCDIVVFTHTDECAVSNQDREYIEGLTVPPFVTTSRHMPSGFRAPNTAGSIALDDIPQPVCLMSAIGSPDGFRHTAEQAGLNVAGEIAFPDHYPLKADDWMRSCQNAQSLGCGSLVTTAKDEMRYNDTVSLPMDVFVLDIALKIDDDTEVKRRILDRIQHNG